jgi:hypothetical protein
MDCEGMAMTKFWVDDKGKLVQATDDSQDLSPLTEVLVAPESGKQVWDGSKWTDPNKVLIYQKRKAEYPTIEECVHAILDDGLEALQAKRKAVKEKYPK